jgi:hypothetical protein
MSKVDRPEREGLSGQSLTRPASPDGGQVVANSSGALAAGEVEINGRRYVTPDRLAGILDVTPRTLARWHAARIGPPKIRVGKLVLYDVAKLPEWLASRETEPVHGRPHPRGRFA